MGTYLILNVSHKNIFNLPDKKLLASESSCPLIFPQFPQSTKSTRIKLVSFLLNLAIVIIKVAHYRALIVPLNY